MHYCLFVTGENIEEKLAPFQEEIDGEKFVISKEELIQKSKKEVEEYATGTYLQYLKDKEAYEVDSTPNHMEYISKDFPKKLKFTDEEHYKNALKWYDEEEINPDGSVNSYCNPIGKWDWYEVGGRWAGTLRIKPDADMTKVKSPNFSWGWDEESKKKVEGKFDSALFKDIDFEAMKKEREAELSKLWEELWDYIVKGEEPPGNLLFRAGLKGENYKGITKEKFLESGSYFSTYAFLHEGEWFTRDDYTEEEWGIVFKEFLKKVSPDTLVTIVDCHT